MFLILLALMMRMDQIINMSVSLIFINIVVSERLDTY